MLSLTFSFSLEFENGHTTFKIHLPTLENERNHSPSRVHIEASLDQLIAISEILSWLTATFRCSLRDQLYSSQSIFKSSTLRNKFFLGLNTIREIYDDGNGTCWLSLFPGSILAFDFPIPRQADYEGL